MKWSKYSLFFNSKNNGWLLYNTASNVFLKVEEDAVDIINQIINSPNEVDYATIPALYFQLRSGGFWVEDGKDEAFYNILKMRRLTANYSTNNLLLTIAPTRTCNFACPYCFEGDRKSVIMSEETENDIINFIKKHRNITSLGIVWYGGEPLIAIDRIKSLNQKIQQLNISYTSQIVTNGYFLDENVVNCLTDLKTKSIQITLDGSKEIHNSRRFLIGGGETFDKIIENIDIVANDTNWNGKVIVRVNVDTTNNEEFVKVFNFLKDRYGEKFGAKIDIYPGFIHDDNDPYASCNYNSVQKGEFILNLAKKLWDKCFANIS